MAELVVLKAVGYAEEYLGIDQFECHACGARFYLSMEAGRDVEHCPGCGAEVKVVY